MLWWLQRGRVFDPIVSVTGQVSFCVMSLLRLRRLLCHVMTTPFRVLVRVFAFRLRPTSLASLVSFFPPSPCA